MFAQQDITNHAYKQQLLIQRSRMQALRKFTSSTAAAASAMVSSRTDDLSRQQGRSGAATGFSNVRRRLYEQALQGAGRSTGSEDTEWAHRRASLAATERQLASLLGFVGKHQSAARTLSGACADLGGELRALYEAGGAGAADAGTTGTGGAAVGTVAAALVGVDEGARREVGAVTSGGGLTQRGGRTQAGLQQRRCGHTALTALLPTAAAAGPPHVRAAGRGAGGARGGPAAGARDGDRGAQAGHARA